MEMDGWGGERWQGEKLEGNRPSDNQPTRGPAEILGDVAYALPSAWHTSTLARTCSLSPSSSYMHTTG